VRTPARYRPPPTVTNPTPRNPHDHHRHEQPPQTAPHPHPDPDPPHPPQATHTADAHDETAHHQPGQPHARPQPPPQPPRCAQSDPSTRLPHTSICPADRGVDSGTATGRYPADPTPGMGEITRISYLPDLSRALLTAEMPREITQGCGVFPVSLVVRLRWSSTPLLVISLPPWVAGLQTHLTPGDLHRANRGTARPCASGYQ
jgi:hypothetical protein